MRWAAGIIVATTLLFAPAWHSARACEAGVCLGQVWPADSATGVPSNARIWVHYEVAGMFEVEVDLVDADGTEVPLSVEVLDGGKLEQVSPKLLVATPLTALARNSEYILSIGTGENVCDDPSPITFQTGTEADETSPDFGGASGVDAWFIEGSGAVGPCDIGPDRHHYEVIGGEGAAGAAAYVLLEDEQPVAWSPSSTALSQIEGTGEPRGRCLVLRAVDVAGNHDDNDVVRCFGEVGDDDDSAAGGDDDAADCSCRTGGSHPGASSVLALMVAAWWMGRRRGHGVGLPSSTSPTIRSIGIKPPNFTGPQEDRFR
jgi:hypothetical protein